MEEHFKPCHECGAVVFDQKRHQRYHDNIYSILRDIKTMIENILHYIFKRDGIKSIK